MQVMRPELTVAESAFVDAYVDTASVELATIKAGWRDNHVGRQALLRPAVAAEIARRYDRRIATEVWPLSVKWAIETLQSKTEKATVKLGIFSKLLDARIKGSLSSGEGEQDLRTLSLDELDEAQHNYELLLAAPQTAEPAGVFD